MNGERKAVLTRGRNLGALLGSIVFVIFGIIPAFYFGSYGTLVLISDLTGGPVEAGVLVRITIVAGIALAVLCACAVCIVAGSVLGTAIAWLVDLVRPLCGFRGEGAGGKKGIEGRRPWLPTKLKAHILSRLSFLQTRYHEIHSVVLVGSAAYGLLEERSDIDIVIIGRNDCTDCLREFLFDHELQAPGESSDEHNFEFTVIDAEQTERYFRMGSPFAHSLRNGIILRDSGFLARLTAADYPLMPTRKYFISAFYEYIAIQYLGAINKLERESRARRCSVECCGKRECCRGLSHSDVLAKTIMRMLYITLPAKGYMPLTKTDVFLMAADVYGRKVAEELRTVTRMARGEEETVYYSDYMRLKPIAASLYREVLHITGLKSDVIRILKNTATLIRGDYSRITDDALRNCVLLDRININSSEAS